MIIIEGTPASPLAQSSPVAITIETPSASENLTVFYTRALVTIARISAVLTGSGGPSLDFTFRHASSRDAVGTEVKTGGFTVSSTSTGADFTVFDSPNLPANSFLWVQTTSGSGVRDSVSFVLYFV